MEAHEGILFVRIAEQKDDGRDERKVGKRPGDVLGKDSDFPLGSNHSSRGRRHRHCASTTGTEGSRGRHLRRALWTRKRHWNDWVHFLVHPITTTATDSSTTAARPL